MKRSMARAKTVRACFLLASSIAIAGSQARAWTMMSFESSASPAAAESSLTLRLNPFMAERLMLDPASDTSWDRSSPGQLVVNRLLRLHVRDRSGLRFRIDPPVSLAMQRGEPLFLTELRVEPPFGGGSVRVFDSGGMVLEVDHFHRLAPSGGVLQLVHGNLSASAKTVRALGLADVKGLVLGGADVIISMADMPIAVPRASDDEACRAPWPGKGVRTDVQLIAAMRNLKTGVPDRIAVHRCVVRGEDAALSPCTPSSTDGTLVISPDASLRNVGESAVPWNQMFLGEAAPYANDQHPFLVWNLYRIDKNRPPVQVARSGLKHAFFSVNGNCPCEAGRVLFPGCDDTYSSYNNDTLNFLGPRSEVIPHLGLWGRCGSEFDRNCDGKFGPIIGLDDGLRNRMTVREEDLVGRKGTEFLFEYWYVVRDDVDPFNTMASRSITARKVPTPDGAATWTIEPRDFILGPAIDRWARQPGARLSKSSDINTPKGRLRLASAAYKLEDGNFTYAYALLNVDYSEYEITGDSSNVEILSSSGPTAFRIALRGTALRDVSALAYFDGDLDSSNDWRAAKAMEHLTWSAPAKSSLAWGSMYSFSLTSKLPPTIALSGSVLHSDKLLSPVEIVVPTFFE